jgi:CPA2 family monovalent cation:H+ antiporter-2
MLLITVLALCFGVSLLAVKLRYSVALGAFVIGAVIAEAREIGRIEALTEPLRDMFCAVFFVAIGLQIDPAILVEHALPVAGLVLAVIVGKAVACTFGSFVAGNDTRTALRVGLGMTQIGEFSFIIASLGLALGVISDFLYPVAVTVSAFTTLTTPWLIRSTDRFVNWFDRTAPRRFVNYLAVYTHWAGQWRETRHRSMANRLIRKWVGQMLLNLLLVAGIFMAAVFAGQRRPGWFGRLQVESEDLKAGLWLAAMLLSLPLLIAVYRKLQALGLLVGELARQRLAGADPRVHAVQTLVANTVQFAGVVAVALVLLVLGSAVLPSTRKLLLLLVVIAGVAFLLWRSFIRVYSKVQYALEETLAQPPPSRAPEVPPALGGLLKQAELEQLELPAASFAVGQLIRQLALRTRTGASVVAIERPGATIVNPGPDEELAANDRLLLLGTRRQLDQARAYLAAPSSGSAS